MSNPTELPDLAALRKIGCLITTQDNRITEAPIFVVEQKTPVISDSDYSDCRVEWRETENGYYQLASEERHERLEALHRAGRDTNGWRRYEVTDIWTFVTACFTEQGCLDYLARNGHNLRETRIYAYGSYRNEEFRTMRTALVELARRAQPEGEAPQADESSEPLDVEFKQLADTILQATTNGTRLEALRGMAALFDKQAAQNVPADTLSPLCGAQHAERGASVTLNGRICLRESIASNGDAMIILTQGYPADSVIRVVGAHTDRNVAAALAAQSQGAQAAGWSIHRDDRGFTVTDGNGIRAVGEEDEPTLCRFLAALTAKAEALTHCDPAEGFCAACREQERVQQAAAQGTVISYGTSAPGTPEAPSDKHLPGWERGIATVTMTGHQLREALDFINPDGDDDADQRDDWLTFGIVQHKNDDGDATTGLCCWNDDSDGVLPLDDYPRAAQLDGGQEGSEK